MATLAAVACALHACAPAEDDTTSGEQAAIGNDSLAPPAAAPANDVTTDETLAPSADASTAPIAQPGRATSGSTPLPCDVAAILARRCQSCHLATPLAGVPMALVSIEDFRAAAWTQPELSVAELAALRVHDAQRPMPPTTPLPAAELAVLDAFFAQGAPAGDDPSCAPPSTDYDGGIIDEDGPPPNSTCYTLRAHGVSAAGDSSPYVVRNQHYACFYYDTPWPEGAQGVYFESDFDDPSLVHHWIVYLDQDGNQPDGHAEVCSPLHPTGPTMVAGWAPGSDNNGLPPGVGMELSPPNEKLLLEFHFFHDGLSAPVETTTGVTICTANEPLENTATISFLGTEAIALAPASMGSASGTCTPQATQDIHILRSWPHMHEHGRSLETTIVRADGSMELLGKWDFDFDNQVSWPTPAVIRPGDRLITTCYFENTTNAFVTTGADTQSEMCFNFVTAYPKNALMSRNALGGSTSATGSATACLE